MSVLTLSSNFLQSVERDDKRMTDRQTRWRGVLYTIVIDEEIYDNDTGGMLKLDIMPALHAISPCCVTYAISSARVTAAIEFLRLDPRTGSSFR